MKPSRIAIGLIGFAFISVIAVFLILRLPSRDIALTENQIEEAFSPSMNEKQIIEGLHRLGVSNFTHDKTVEPGFWRAEDMPERRYTNYDGFTDDELSRTVSTISFDRAIGAEWLSFSTRYVSGTFLLDSNEKLIAFRSRSYNEGL